jgi:PLD-like domain
MNKLENLKVLIEQYQGQLILPGVIAVRPGYLLANGWPTQAPAIVVTVLPGVPRPELPADCGGVTVDVREATGVEELAGREPERIQLVALQRAEFRTDSFGMAEALPAAAPTVDLLAAKPRLGYTPPPGIPLTSVEGNMTITCHASPDAGWPTLQEFLRGTQEKLTIGLYDFTAAHILTALEQSLLGDKELTLTLDNPARNHTADQSDSETIEALADSLGDQFSAAWALVKSNPAVNQWIYPSAYHIKVAVRDGAALWLSSGNWNNSNQPKIDPIGDPQEGDQQRAKRSDRDWHVVIENEPLAQTYEAYLLHDFEVAAVGAHNAGVGMQAIPAVAVSVPEALAMGQFNFFPPLRLVDEPMRITPLLTPDTGSYQPAMLNLLRSAHQRLYIQLQYIHPSDRAEDVGLTELIDAVISRHAAGVDVRIILSQWQTTNGWLERLQAAGVDLRVVKIQNGVHNKGFIVDSCIVALGSQNWSGDGVVRNRDATVIIENSRAAQYYEEIFLHDWERLARQSVNN